MQESGQKNVWPGWETVKLLGRGSFGAVYEIRREVFGEVERAALKCITIPQSESEITQLREEGYDEESITGTYKEQLKSIIAEYSMMRKLNGSSYVVSCDDVRYVQHDDGIGWDIFIKMELLTPLTKSLGDSVSEGTVVRIGSDLCKALGLCRRYSIIHRDIKPANIFVSNNGDYKLGDFGVAKTMERTSGGTKIGTYDYMAPEVYRGLPYGSTVDIYSLGLVLYWLLNERRGPFMPLPPANQTLSGREQARERRFRGETLPPPAHGSKGLKSIVMKACAYEAKDRYQTAEEMLTDLERLRFSSRGQAFPAGDEKTVGVGFEAEENRPQTVYGPPPLRGKSPVQRQDSISEKKPENGEQKPENQKKPREEAYRPEENFPVDVYGPPHVQGKTPVQRPDSDREKKPDNTKNPRIATDPINPRNQRNPRKEDFRPDDNQAAPLYGPPAGGSGGQDGAPLWLKILAIVLAVVGVVLALLAARRLLAGRGTDTDTAQQTVAEETASEEDDGEREAELEETEGRATTENGAADYEAGYLAEGEVAEDEDTLSATVSLQSADGLSRVSFVTAAASSEFYQSDIDTTFSADGAISGTGNPWVEGAAGHGIGEWLRLYFSQEESISHLYLRLGFASSEKLYQGNNRPSRLRISFSDGSGVDCDFLDLRTPMLVTLSEPVSTSYVQLTILDVYPGNIDDDTCILLAAAYR